MPTPLKSTGNMRKHLTKAEREARMASEGSLHSGKRPTVRAPEWLSDEARRIFESTKRKLRGMDLLESCDADLLAMYADAVARYQTAVRGSNLDFRVSQNAQAWSRLALSYAEKMGISATGRARLAKKRAEAQPMDDMDALLNEVSDFVNGDER